MLSGDTTMVSRAGHRLRHQNPKLQLCVCQKVHTYVHQKKTNTCNWAVENCMCINTYIYTFICISLHCNALCIYIYMYVYMLPWNRHRTPKHPDNCFDDSQEMWCSLMISRIWPSNLFTGSLSCTAWPNTAFGPMSHYSAVYIHICTHTVYIYMCKIFVR